MGESGSGKTVSALAVMGLLPHPPFRVKSGSIFFEGVELTSLRRREISRMRGRRMSMVFQEPMTALNPVFTIGYQIKEGIAAHERLSSGQLHGRALEMLGQVGMPEPEYGLKAYPHELSGGLRQRAMLAIALAARPVFLIADEPTTSLDVSLQARILKLLSNLRSERGLALLVITHNLGIVAQVAQRVVIMYAGKIVEDAPVLDIFDAPLHPYTRGLLESIPYSAGQGGVECSEKCRLRSIPGNIPPLDAIPRGCPFQDRCREAMDVCRTVDPVDINVGKSRIVACHLYGSL